MNQPRYRLYILLGLLLVMTSGCARTVKPTAPVTERHGRDDGSPPTRNLSEDTDRRWESRGPTSALQPRGRTQSSPTTSQREEYMEGALRRINAYDTRVKDLRRSDALVARSTLSSLDNQIQLARREWRSLKRARNDDFASDREILDSYLEDIQRTLTSAKAE